MMKNGWDDKYIVCMIGNKLCGKTTLANAFKTGNIIIKSAFVEAYPFSKDGSVIAVDTESISEDAYSLEKDGLSILGINEVLQTGRAFKLILVLNVEELCANQGKENLVQQLTYVSRLLNQEYFGDRHDLKHLIEPVFVKFGDFGKDTILHKLE